MLVTSAGRTEPSAACTRTAGMGSTTYSLFLLLHILTVVVAFGATFVQPMLARSGQVGNDVFRRNTLFIQLPGLVALWVTGMGLAGLSEKVWRMSQTWLILALVVFAVGVAVLVVMARAYGSGQTKMVPMLNGVMHLLLVAGLYLMIWKPGG